MASSLIKECSWQFIVMNASRQHPLLFHPLTTGRKGQISKVSPTSCAGRLQPQASRNKSDPTHTRNATVTGP